MKVKDNLEAQTWIQGSYMGVNQGVHWMESVLKFFW